MAWDDENVVEGSELTPEQEEANRVAEFGVFHSSKVTADATNKIVTCIIDDTLPGKSKITMELDMAVAGFMIFEEVAKQLNAQADALRKARKLV